MNYSWKRVQVKLFQHALSMTLIASLAICGNSSLAATPTPTEAQPSATIQSTAIQSIVTSSPKTAQAELKKTESSAPCGTPGSTCSSDEEVALASSIVKVCPWYPVIVWDDYTTYYAEICFGRYVLVDAPHGLSFSSCYDEELNDCMNMEDPESLVVRKAGGMIYAAQRELAVKGLGEYSKTPSWGKGVEVVGTPRLVSFTKAEKDGPPRKISAKLYLLRAVGAETDEFFGVAQEIPYQADAPFITSVERKSHSSFNIRLGSIVYPMIGVQQNQAAEASAEGLAATKQ